MGDVGSKCHPPGSQWVALGKQQHPQPRLPSRVVVSTKYINKVILSIPKSIEVNGLRGGNPVLRISLEVTEFFLLIKREREQPLCKQKHSHTYPEIKTSSTE